MHNLVVLVLFTQGGGGVAWGRPRAHIVHLAPPTHVPSAARDTSPRSLLTIVPTHPAALPRTVIIDEGMQLPLSLLLTIVTAAVTLPQPRVAREQHGLPAPRSLDLYVLQVPALVHGIPYPAFLDVHTPDQANVLRWWYVRARASSLLTTRDLCQKQGPYVVASLFRFCGTRHMSCLCGCGWEGMPFIQLPLKGGIHVRYMCDMCRRMKHYLHVRYTCDMCRRMKHYLQGQTTGWILQALWHQACEHVCKAKGALACAPTLTQRLPPCNLTIHLGHRNIKGMGRTAGEQLRFAVTQGESISGPMSAYELDGGRSNCSCTTQVACHNLCVRSMQKACVVCAYVRVCACACVCKYKCELMCARAYMVVHLCCVYVLACVCMCICTSVMCVMRICALLCAFVYTCGHVCMLY